MANREDLPRTTPAEIEQLIRQIRATNLDQGSNDKIERLLRTVLTLVELLQRRKTSIKKLREMIFGRRTEKHHAKKPDGAGKKSESGADEKGSPEASADPATGREQNLIEPEEKSRRKGHGHRAITEYRGARTVPCRHEQLKAGDKCPYFLCGGRLYASMLALNRLPEHLFVVGGSPLMRSQ